MLCFLLMFCVSPVGGPHVSVAQKRSADYTAVNDIKRPALESVASNNLQVLLSICVTSINFCVLS